MNTDSVVMSLTDWGVLAQVLEILDRQEHKDDCPRIRDDYDCTCGRDALIFRVEQMQDKHMNGRNDERPLDETEPEELEFKPGDGYEPRHYKGWDDIPDLESDPF